MARRSRAAAIQPTWKLEDAKARFSELVRRARSEGPQRVSVRGRDAVVVIAVETLDNLLPTAKPHQSLTAFLQSLDLSGVDVTRERDTGRGVPI